MNPSCLQSGISTFTTLLFNNITNLLSSYATHLTNEAFSLDLRGYKKNKHHQITSYHLYYQNGMMVALDHALLRFLSARESYAMNNL